MPSATLEDDADDSDEDECWLRLEPLFASARLCDPSKAVALRLSSGVVIRVDQDPRAFTAGSAGAESATERQSTTAALVWDASIALAHELRERFGEPPPRGDGAVAIELGAGRGLLGTALAADGWTAVLTDRTGALAHAEATARANAAVTAGRLSIEALHWGDRPAAAALARRHADVRVVAAADCIYDTDLVAPFLATVRVLLHVGGGRAIVAFDTSIGRHEAYARFREEAVQRFERAVELPPAREKADVRVFELKGPVGDGLFY